jgi:hypothetical protein
MVVLIGVCECIDRSIGFDSCSLRSVGEDMIYQSVVSVLVALFAVGASRELAADVGANPAYVCSFCIIALGLVEESVYQLHLQEYLQSKCTSDACKATIQRIILAAEEKRIPEETCREVQLCTDQCVAFDTWPVNPLPAKPTEWPIERKLLDGVGTEGLTEVRSIFEDLVKQDGSKYQSFWEVMVQGLGRLTGKKVPSYSSQGIESDAPLPNCGNNVSCHIYNFVEWSLPLQDSDGDWFANKEARRFRGYDWRGYDCNDEVIPKLSCILYYNLCNS